MISLRRFSLRYFCLFGAVLLSMLGFLLLFPTPAEAHAILLRTDPAPDATLHTAPQQVQLWFSEALNPAFSTVTVEDALSQQCVDAHDAQVPADNTSELVVSLRPHLSPGHYVVIWRSDSNDDGHIETGSFLFTILLPNGSLPKTQKNVLSAQQFTQAAGNSAFASFFSFVMFTLLEIGVVFWVGAQVWLLCSMPKAASNQRDNTAEMAPYQQMRNRFERRLALPSVAVLFLANMGVLLGQALSLVGNHWTDAFTPLTLTRLISSSTFGTVWLLRCLLLLLALWLADSPSRSRTPSEPVRRILQWTNLPLGMLLLATMALSSHAAALNTPLVTVALFSDGLHLLAAVLWVGGMLALATLALPVLVRYETSVQARALITTLQAYTPWAIAGVLLMALTGPFSAVTQLYGWQQLLTTLYGQVLTLKILLVGLLLLTSATHVFWLRPRLKRSFAKYTATHHRQQQYQQTPQSERAAKRFAHLLTLREKRLAQQTRQLTTILRWEPVVGIAILVCVGLMNSFAGTLTPLPTRNTQTVPASQQPFHTTMDTFDRAFRVTLTLTPNQIGTNQFTVTIVDTQTNTAATHITADLNTEMPAMDMGVSLIPLTADGNGHFHGQGDLAMAGQWQIIVQISTAADPYHFHEAYTMLSTP